MKTKRNIHSNQILKFSAKTFLLSKYTFFGIWFQLLNNGIVIASLSFNAACLCFSCPPYFGWHCYPSALWIMVMMTSRVTEWWPQSTGPCWPGGALWPVTSAWGSWGSMTRSPTRCSVWTRRRARRMSFWSVRRVPQPSHQLQQPLQAVQKRQYQH